MKLPVALILFCGFCSASRSEDNSSAWICLPDEKALHSGDVFPSRLILHSDGSATLTMLVAGVRRDMPPLPKLQEGIQIKREQGSVTLLGTGQQMVFKKLPDWEKRFESASPVPQTKKEAIDALKKILSSDIGEMRLEELDALNGALGNLLRMAFDLDNPKSPLLADLGEHRDSSATKELLILFWKTLQKNPR